jgi:hypothetical protein
MGTMTRTTKDNDAIKGTPSLLSLDADGKGAHGATALAQLVGAPDLNADYTFLV